MKHLFSLFITLLSSSLTWAQCSLTYTMDPLPASCAGSCDGSITVTFSNSGTAAAPYNAIFENSLGVIVGSHTFFTESGTYTFNGVCAESHTVTLVSIPNPTCTYQEVIVVTEPPAIVITSAVVVHETSGMTNGQITINATGGVMPFTYSINNGGSFQASNNFPGLNSGIYPVVVKDANGCEISQPVSVGEKTTSGCEVEAAVIPQPTSCAGSCDGNIQYEYDNLQVVPGAPYDITIEDSDGNIIDNQILGVETQYILFDDLCGDTYTITLQGSTCTFTIMSMVPQPPGMTLWVNSTDPSFGNADGSAELVVLGGVPGYVYSLDGGGAYQLSPNFSGLDDGTFPAAVKDANGCEKLLDFTLADPTICTVSITASQSATPLCHGSCEGAISYSYSDVNPHGPYFIHLIQSGVILQTNTHGSASGTGTFTNLCAGNYTVKVTDELLNTSTGSVTITEPAALNITSANATSTDPGAGDGTVTITATGGQPAYIYSLDGATFFGANNFTDLAAGLHTSYVKDANGCADELPFLVHENLPCDYNINTSVEMSSCTGSCGGTIHFAFNGSLSDTPFYVILEKDGNVISSEVTPSVNVVDSITDLCPGAYILRVGNSSGCEQLALALVNEPEVLSVVASTELASTGNNDGAIVITPTGGTAPYQYSVDNQATWQSTSTVGGLGAGEYTAWVRDTNGCVAFYIVELEDTSSCSMIINITKSEPACPGYCDATLACTFLDVNVNPPFVIQLFKDGVMIDTSAIFPTGFSGLHQFTDLCYGAYVVAVVDGDGCTDARNVYIHEPPVVEMLDAITTDASVGGSDGSAELVMQGGTAPYEFTIDFGTTWQDENIFLGLDSGYYVIMVKDAHDCFFNHGFVINEQPGCDIQTTFFLLSPISCHDTVDAVIQYSYFEAVNTPPYNLKLTYNSVISYEYNLPTNSYSSTWTALPQGVFGIEVTNGNGCKSYVPNVIITIPEEIEINGTITGTSNGLDNGTIEFYTTGGFGQHMYSLDTTFGYYPTTFFDDLATGAYVGFVVDAHGCQDTLNFLIDEDPGCDIVINALTDPIVACAGDCSAALSFDYHDANFNPPYSVLLTNSAGGAIGSDVGLTANGIGLFTGLCAGTYNVTVTDASGCQSIPAVGTIAEPAYIDVAISAVHPTDNYYNGSITLNASGGTPPYEYSNNNQVTWSATNSWTLLSEGFYLVYVRDANGCIQLVVVILDDQWVTSVVELSEDILVYPNPTQGMVFVNAESVQSVTAYDVNGKQVELPQTIAANGVALDFTNASAGTYLLEIVTLKGELLRTQVVKN